MSYRCQAMDWLLKSGYSIEFASVGSDTMCTIRRYGPDMAMEDIVRCGEWGGALIQCAMVIGWEPDKKQEGE
jgi:hypothetical protein